jgi:mono/diheme cytochrome c family protein
MTPLNYLTDEQVANVLTYVQSSFGNNGEAVKPQDVTRVRQQAPPVAKNQFE